MNCITGPWTASVYLWDVIQPCRDCKFHLFLRVRRSQTCWAGWNSQQVELLALTSQTWAMQGLWLSRKDRLFPPSEQWHCSKKKTTTKKQKTGRGFLMQFSETTAMVQYLHRGLHQQNTGCSSGKMAQSQHFAAQCRVGRQNTVYLATLTKEKITVILSVTQFDSKGCCMVFRHLWVFKLDFMDCISS